MRYKTLALVLLVGAAPLVGCLQKDTSTTIFIRNDGSIEWSVLDRNVRSDETDPGKRADEEQNYLYAVQGGTDDLTAGFRVLGGTNIRAEVLRDRVPFSTLRSADFTNMNQVWERAFLKCQVPHRIELKTDGVTTTWTMAIQVDPEPDEAVGCDTKAIEALLSDSSEHLRIMLESGKFVSATGFTLAGSDTAEVRDIDSDTITKNGGVVTLSLTWERMAR